MMSPILTPALCRTRISSNSFPYHPILTDPQKNSTSTKPPTRKSLHQAAPLSAGITPAEISPCAHRAKSARQHKKVSHRWKPSLCTSLSTPTTGCPPAPLIRRSVQEMQAASHRPQMPTQPVPQAPSQPRRNCGHAKPRRRAPGTGTAAACPSHGTGEHAPSSWTPSPPLRTAPADCV